MALGTGAAYAALGFPGPSRLGAIEPIARKGSPRFKLSLVGYSFRRYFTEKDPAKRITMFDFIDYCADQGFAGAELTGYFFPQPLTDAGLIAVKRHAYLRGVAISGTSMKTDFAQIDRGKLAAQVDAAKSWVQHAALLGAPYLRVFAGHGVDVQVEARKRACIEGMEEVAEYAGARGVFLGMENDGGVTPDQTLDIVHGVKSPWFGLNLDLGNFHSEDVYRDLVRCAPYAINVHIKREMQMAGRPSEPADVPRLLRILRGADYQGYLALEYEADPDPYRTIPGWKREITAALAPFRLSRIGGSGPSAMKASRLVLPAAGAFLALLTGSGASGTPSP